MNRNPTLRMTRNPAIVLLFAVLLGLNVPLPAQEAPETPRSLENWNQQFSEALTEPSRIETLMRAAGDGEDDASRLFLQELAKDFPRGRHAERAARELARHRGTDFVAWILDTAKRRSKRSEKIEVMSWLERIPEQRERGFEALVSELLDHSNDHYGLGLLTIVERYIVKPASDESKARLSGLLLELYQDPASSILSGPAFRAAQALDEESRLPFLVAALENLDPVHAKASTAELIRRRVDGVEDLVVQFFVDHHDDALRAGFLDLFAADDRLLLWLRLLERVDELSWKSLHRLRLLLAELEVPALRSFLLSSLEREDRPKLVALSLLWVRDGKVTLAAPALKERLLGSSNLRLRILASEVLSQISGDERWWKRARRLFDTGRLAPKLDALEALTDLNLDSARVRDWMRGALVKQKGKWQILGHLLRAVGSLGFDDLTDLCTPFLEHRRWQIRLAAVEAMVQGGRRDSLPRLAEMTGAPQTRVAHAAAEGLYGMTGQRFGLNPDDWRRFIAKLPRDWKALQLPPFGGEDANEERYGPRFYGLDLRSNRVIFVCDISGSMQGIKLKTLRRELEGAVESLRAPGGFNLVFFSDAVRPTWSKMARAVPRLKKRAIKKIAQIQADGGTNLWGGLEEAFRDAQADTIVVLTDGQPSAGKIMIPEAILQAVRHTNRYQRFQIHAIYVPGVRAPTVPGFVPRPMVETGAASFMRRLAEQNEGQYVLAGFRPS